MLKFLISAHLVFTKKGVDIHGPPHKPSGYFDEKGIDHFFIKHSLYGGRKTEIEEHRGGRCSKVRLIGMAKIPFFLHLIQDEIINFWYLSRKKPQVFIGVNPINGAVGILAKKLGWVEKAIFFTADYAFKRFDNPLLNKGYHWLDRFAAFRADQVWNVSKRITRVRKKQGISDQKNFFVPNTPNFDQCTRLPYSKINKHDLVIVGNITKALDCEMAVRAINNLSKRYVDIRLWVIGVGDGLDALKKLAKAQKVKSRIIFPGRMEHDKLLKFMSSCAVGVALYSGRSPWSEFGDSVKTREYMACGLPVIVSDIISTAQDIKKAKAGLIIKDQTELEKAIDRLFSDRRFYSKTRQNAIVLAEKYDFRKVMDDVLAKLMPPALNN